MHSHDHEHQPAQPTPPTATPRPRPPRARQDWGTGDRRSPQLGLRDADVVRELTATSR